MGQTSENPSGSLGDIVKKSRAGSAAKAKKVFTDDDLNVRKNPIPRVSLQGEDNTDQVLNAVREFRKSHTVTELESAVHEWFDEHDQILATAAEDNTQISQHNQYRREAQDEGYENNTRDYDQMRQKMATERRSQRVDARRNQDNWQAISRIQQTMQKVRMELQMNGLRCEWFRIRQGSGVGTY